MSRPLPRVGRYELREELGRGGVGAVYRAFDPTSGRDVAIKVLLAAARLQPEDLARFRVEAAAGQRLRHPGIVAVRDSGVADGVQFIVMDLVEGGSLRQRLKSGAFEPEEAARLIEQLARALSFAHAQGVLHRDIKPGNVLLGSKGEPLLTDFGMAQLVGAERLTHTGDVLGTPHYMPPEQARGDRSQHGPWTDVYALGVTLYELLTGRTPFSGDSALAVIEALLRSEPPRPSALRPGLDPALEEICLRAMARTPARRYVTAEALADDLAAWLDRPRQTTRGARRRGLLVGGLLVGGALVALAVAVMLAVRAAPPGGDAAAITTTTTDAAAKVVRHELALKVHALVNQAAERVRAGDMRGSAELLDRAIALDPTHGNAYARRAFARAHLDDQAGALADAERAVELEPTSALAHQARASIALLAGDLERAEAGLARGLELDPSDGDMWVELALVRGSQQRHERALEDLRSAIPLKRDSYTVADVHGLMAKFLWADGRTSEALEQVDLALGLDRDARTALEVRAAHRLKENDLRGALDDATRADAILATFEAAFVKGVARAGLGDLGGRADLERAARLARDAGQRSTASNALIGIVRKIQQDLNALAARDVVAAIAACDRLLATDPDFEAVRFLRGRLRVFVGDAAGATLDFDRIVEAGGAGVVNALLERAIALTMVGDVQGARADADRAVELRPDEAATWRIRGRVRGEANDHAGALADLERAIALRDDGQSRLWRGALRVGEGKDLQGALDDLARAEESRLAPQDQATVVMFRCMALLALGRLTEAAELSARAVREAPPGAADVWSMHSEVLLRLRRGEEAVAAAGRAIQVAPSEATHRLRRAAAYLSMNDLTPARADIAEGLRLSGDGFVGGKLRALERRATAFVAASAALKRGDKAGACAVMEELVKGSPDEIDVRVMHASFLLAIGDLAAAREATDRAVALVPHDLHARALRADLVPPEQGLSDLTYVLAVTPDDVELLARRADVLHRLGRADEGRVDLERAIAVPATTPFALLFRARARLHLGDVAGAERDLDASIALDPDLPQLRLERAHVTRFYAPDRALADLEHARRFVRNGPVWDTSQRELAHVRRALDGGPTAPCDWSHLHPETSPR